MNIEEKINESKRRTQLMNGVTIDWQYAQQIIPSVLPIMAKDVNGSNLHELKTLSETLYKLFSNIETGVKELKQMIPINMEGEIINE